MPDFDITAPDGKKFRVTAPEGATQEQALERVKAQYAAQPQGQESLLGRAAEVGKGALEFGKGLATGVAKGAEAFPGAMASIMGAAGRGAESLGLGNPEEAAKREQFRKDNPLPTATGGLHAPETTAGKYGESIGEFVPAAAVSPGSWISRIVSAFGGGAGAQAAADLVNDPGTEPYARIIGGIAGAMLPGGMARAANPLPATPHHAAHVATIEREGVTGLSAGERTGSRALRYAEEHLGGSPLAGRAADDALTLPREQFTRAALARVGEVADRATPEVIDRAHRRIGNQFDALSARNSARVDQTYIQDLLRAQQEYDFLFVDPLRKPTVQNVIDHAVNKLSQSNTMTGAEYKALRSRIERMRRDQHKDPEMNQFLASVRDAMDGLMERSIRANNPADLGAWQQVRNQYRNLLVIDRATTGAETGGLVTPSKLKQGAVGQNRTAYARGQGDFAELARSGENVLPGLPQSGTAPRALTQAGVTKLVTTGATGRALMSRPVQAWLGNQSLNAILDQLPGPTRAAITSVIANAPELQKDAP